MGQDVDPLLQVAVLRVQQRRLLALEGAVGGVGVLPELADHGELRGTNRAQQQRWRMSRAARASHPDNAAIEGEGERQHLFINVFVCAGPPAALGTF